MNKFINVIDDYLLKYAYYREPVAGSKYLDINFDELKEGVSIEFEIDSSNTHDENAIKLYQNNIHIGYVHKNYIQDMIQTYSKKREYKIEIILNKIDIEKEELTFQIGFYQKYNTVSFNILNRFSVNSNAINNKYYNLRKNKKTNQYYIEETGYIFSSEENDKIKNYLDINAFVVLKGQVNNTIEVLFVI